MGRDDLLMAWQSGWSERDRLPREHAASHYNEALSGFLAALPPDTSPVRAFVRHLLEQPVWKRRQMVRELSDRVEGRTAHRDEP